MPRILCALLFAAISAMATPAVAWMSTPVLNPENGHYYAFFNGSSNVSYTGAPLMPFEDARARAGALSHLGIPGHLVTITSKSEQDFIHQQYLALVGPNRDKPFGGSYFFWIGASDAEVEGEWRWTDGPEAGQLFWLGSETGVGLGYDNWSGTIGGRSEPNNAPDEFDPAGEDYAAMLLRSTGGSPSYWNDVSNGDVDNFWTPKHGIVEFSPVPEPSTGAIVVTAGFSLLAARRRRN